MRFIFLDSNARVNYGVFGWQHSICDYVVYVQVGSGWIAFYGLKN